MSNSVMEIADFGARLDKIEEKLDSFGAKLDKIEVMLNRMDHTIDTIEKRGDPNNISEFMSQVDLKTVVPQYMDALNRVTNEIRDVNKENPGPGLNLVYPR